MALPQLSNDTGVSADVFAATKALPGGYGELAGAVDQFGAQIGQMADRAAQAGGVRMASEDVGAGTVKPQDPATTFGAAYNQVAKDQLKAQMAAAISGQVGQAYANNPADPVALDQSLQAIKAGIGSTPFPDVNNELDSHFQLEAANKMSAAYVGQHAKMVETAKASFDQTLSTQAQLLDQTAAGASFDQGGAARVTAAYGLMVKGLAQYGPRTAFSLGGQDFPADPTRQNMLDPATMQLALQAAQAEAKRTWILETVKKLPTAAAQSDMLTQLRQRWAAQDPMLSGMTGREFDILDQRVGDVISKSQFAERGAVEQHAQKASQMIEALRMGGVVDTDDMIQEAQASGRPDIIANANFYAEVDRSMPGVLKTVARRALGLIPEKGAVSWVGPDGKPLPVPGATAPADAGDPGWVDPAAKLAGILGGAPTITSTVRTPAHNAAVGGVPDSYHLTGHAVDFTPPAGMTNAQAVAKIRAADPSVVELLDEGNHVHVAWRGPATTATPATVQPGTPAYAAWASTQEGFSSDPIGFVQKRGVADPPVVVPQSAFSDNPADTQAWGQAIRARQAFGQVLGRTYGVPARMLTDGEAKDYGALLQANPTAAPKLAEAALYALGPSGASQLLQEIGLKEGSPVAALQIANLHINGSTQFAQTATDGLALRAAGAKVPAFDTKDDPSLQKWDAAQADLAPAFVHTPDQLNAVRQVAELARLSDAHKGIEHDAGYYLQSAAGGKTIGGVMYGGVAPVNGAPAVLPPWLAQGRATDALAALGDNWTARGSGPRFSNGQVVNGAYASRLRLALLPNGHYWLADPRTNQLLKGQTGAPFELDFDGAKRFLQLRVPGAVAGGG